MAQLPVTLDKVVGYFDELEDPRATINRKHPLVSVVVIALMAVLAGAGGPTALAMGAACQEEFLSGVLPLPPGIPRKGCVSTRAGVVAAGRFSSLLRDLVAVVA